MPRLTNLDSIGFKFAIGDTLLHKGAAHLPSPPKNKEEGREWRYSFDQRTLATCCRFVVTQRVAEECPGGVQLKYVLTAVSGLTGDIVTMNHYFLEEELIPLPV